MFISVAELEAFMGKTFDLTEETQAESIISMVSSFIKNRVKNVSFSLVEDDVITTQADGHGIVELYSRPIQYITSVVDINGDSIEDYDFDGLRAIYNLFPLQVVTITFTHGYSTTPDDIKDVTKAAAARIMYNPAGHRQETVGAISLTYPGMGGEAGSVTFSSEERRILESYSSGDASLRLGVLHRKTSGMPVLTISNNIS